MPKKMNVLQRRAVAFEKMGVNMYLEAADKTLNPLARRLFYSLAIEEIEHITFIEDRWKDKEIKASGLEIEERVRKVFKTLEEHEIKDESDNVEALERAMELEKRGREFYLALQNESSSDEERDFFAKLAAEEEKHLTSLENVYRFLTDSSEWFHSAETTTWNWMNI